MTLPLPTTLAARAFAAILLAFVLLAGWYSVAIPVGEAVDEIPHFEYVRYVATHHALPIQPWADNGQPWDVTMGHHPPLYYALAAALTSWIDISDYQAVIKPNPHFDWIENDFHNGAAVQLHSAAEDFPYRGTALALHFLRALSIIMGLVTLAAVYGIARLVVPALPWVAVAATAIVAFNPSFIFMSASIQNDPLMTMLFSLSLWWMVHALEYYPSNGTIVVGGVLLGAGMLTKLTGMSLIPLFGLTLVLVAYTKRDARRLVTSSVVLFGIAALVAGWWYVRNLLLYGDLLGWGMYVSTYSFLARNGPYTWTIIQDEVLNQIARTSWGAFGYMHITLPSPIWGFFWIVSGIAALLTAVTLVVRRKEFLVGGAWQKWLILALAVVLVFASVLRHNQVIAAGAHGRFLFTVVAPFALVVAFGLNAATLFRWPRTVAAVVGGGLALYAVLVPLIFVLPLYAPAETASPLDVQAATASDVSYGHALRLVGYQLQPNSVRAGEPVSLALYWQPEGNGRPDLYANVRVRSGDGKTILRDEFWPAPNSSTSEWSDGSIYVTRRALALPPDVKPGAYRVEVSLRLGQGGDTIPALDAAGNAIGTWFRVGGVQVQ
ncbi:MAG: glycosyltransferase family 39 protein [Anaerolineae bacterium]